MSPDPEILCLADIVRIHASLRPDGPAVACGDTSRSFDQLYARAKAVAGALIASGVEPQDRVAVLDRNGVETLEVVFGAALLDAVAVTVNWRLAPPEIAGILTDAAARAVIVGQDFLPAIETVEELLDPRTRVIAIGGHDRFESYESWLSAQAGVDPGTVAAPTDVAIQLYTSGTTGVPKGVMLTTSNLLCAWAGIRDEWGFDPDRSVNMAIMPMFHIGGLGWAAAGLFFGCSTVVVRDVVPSEVLRLIAAERVTHVFVVPAVIQMLLQCQELSSEGTSSLEKLVYGASPVAAAVLEEAIATIGCDFVQVYGLTETTGAITQLDAEDHDPSNRPALLRSCGKPYPWVEIRIVDATTGDDVGAGAVGELWTRSDQNMAGYWNQPEATAAVLDAEGWLRTGDAGYVDADGYMYLHDRVKDMIVSGGENIYPAEIENTLMRHPAVADAAVFGVPDTRWGEAVKAAVVVAPGENLGAEELIAFCRDHLAGYKCPKSVEFRSTLPRNPSGKLLKRELRAPYWESQERQVG